MTQKQHTFTPPPELVQQWCNKGFGQDGTLLEYVATRAAQWGADQELQHCAGWVGRFTHSRSSDLIDARRPKPPSLKQQALNALQRYISGETVLIDASIDTIRLALEQLPNE